MPFTPVEFVCSTQNRWVTGHSVSRKMGPKGHIIELTASGIQSVSHIIDNRCINNDFCPIECL